MHTLLASIALCFVAQVAAAQGLPDPAAGAAPARPDAALVASAAAPDPAPAPGAGGELIKTAAASPREVAMRQPSVAPGASKSQAGDEEQPRRAGPAMLLTALAVMTAIALRRSGASGR